MPRQARFVLPGKLYHVTQRGNYCQNVFFENQDRAVYLKYLNESIKKYNVKLYAFCLMDNHVHFVVKPLKADSLAKTFRVTHQKYSKYINNRLKEYGHRWQARFYSCILLGDHIAHAIRYVEQNPVRAKMVGVPWQYSWSSAKAHLGKSYKIIDLSNVKEYVSFKSWKDFLMYEDNLNQIDLLRESTKQGKAFGPAQMIQQLEKRFDVCLHLRSKGRQRKKI